jgi:hypothetical protein
MVTFLLFSPFWLYINVVCLAIREGWDFTCMWKALAWPYHFPKRGIWVVHKTSLNPPHVIEMPVPSQESGRSCVCVILPRSTIVLLDWNVFRKCGIFCFSFYRHFYEKNLKIYNMCQYYLISINISYVYSKLVHDYFLILYWSRRGRDRMLVGSTTTYAIGAYPHWCCGFDCRSGLGEQHYVIKFVSDLWQVGGFLGFSTITAHLHDITEILLKVALNTKKPN